MAPFWTEKQLVWTQGFILPKSEKNSVKCENEGIFGVSKIAKIPEKEKIKVMKIARFLCLVAIVSQKIRMYA
jgi:hypothetical protein